MAIRKDGTIDRSGYLYEGPNGTPRPKVDVSPNERLLVRPFERCLASWDRWDVSDVAAETAPWPDADLGGEG